MKLYSINNIPNHLASTFYRRHGWKIVILLVLTSIYFLRELRVDFELEKLFPQKDKDLNFYLSIVEDNGYDNDFLLVTLIPEKNFFDQNYLKNIDELKTKLKENDHVVSVRSPLDVPFLYKSPTGLFKSPSLHIDEPDRYASDSLRIAKSRFHSETYGDFSMINLYIQHKHFTDPESSASFYNEIESLIDTYSGSYNIIGKLPAETAFRELIQKDFLFYFIASVVLCMLILWLIYRKLLLIFLPLIIGVVALIITLGIMALVGIPISIMSVLLPPLVLFISTSDSIHIITSSIESGYKSAVNKVLGPTFITSITTSIGFLSLLWIDVIPIREFGVSAAIGTITAFVITYLISPRFLSGKLRVKSIDRNYKISRLRHPTLVTVCILIGMIIAISGISKNEVDAKLLSDLPSDHPIVSSFKFADEKFGGSKPWMINVIVKDGEIWDPKVVKEISKLQNIVKNQFGLSNVYSVVNPTKYVHEVYSGHYDLNNLKKKDIQAIKSFTGHKNDTSLLISGFIPEWGSKETIQKSRNLDQTLSRKINSAILQWKITGTTFLIDKSHHSLSKKLIKGLFTAILAVSICIGLFFRSFKLALVSLLPNIMTVLVLFGIIGWLGIPLQLTNAIVFSVAFGIAVDDTIHFIAAYRKQDKTLLPYEKINLTLDSTGFAIINTSIVITFGFSLFLLSSFGATFYMGLFMVLAVLIALILDLYLLPLILKAIEPNDS